MRRKFVNGIGNVRGVTEYLTSLGAFEKGPCLGLIQGAPGLGKTRTSIWLTTQNPDTFFYVRAHSEWTPPWMFSDLLAEFNLEPERILEKRVKQFCAALQGRSKTLLIIDEADLIAGKQPLIQSLRYVFDMTSVPVVLVGLPSTERFLRNSGPYLDRIASIFSFDRLSSSDITLAVQELCEIPFTQEAVDMLAGYVEPRMRAVERFIMDIERSAKANGWNEICPEKLKAWQKSRKRAQVQAKR